MSESPLPTPSAASSAETTQAAAVQPPRDAPLRAQIDRSCREVVALWVVSGVFWLIVGSALAIIASVKLHTPEFVGDVEWLTFGRARPAHLNTMIYGWASMAGIGVLLWLQARLNRCRLPYRFALLIGGLLWNIAVAWGTVGILAGRGTSIEWLEFPLEAVIILAAVFMIITAASMRMLLNHGREHIYVSQWYLCGAVFWFPFLYVAAQILVFGTYAGGVSNAACNWWFAHNVLGLWLTPIGLAAAYYFIPKVIGRPIHSYYLSILGFWSLALFYNWAGSHHLIGGPLPAWLITVGIVGSMMMFIPVITVAVNHHLTMVGHFHKLIHSPTLRFTVFGAMAYTAVSVQGSLTSLRWVNETTHFTHYTVAHAHLGVYAFYTMAIYGAIYYIMPRLIRREWFSANLIRVHFWTTAVGMAIYWLGLTFGGVLQGMELNDPNIPFLDVVAGTLPYLWSRSVAGVLMTIGHVAFAVLVWKMLRREGTWQVGPTLLSGRRGRLGAGESDSGQVGAGATPPATA